MLGLCHICLTSGVPIFISKGVVYCEICRDGRTQEKEKEKEKETPKRSIFLKFEDLPLLDLKQRSVYAYEVVKQLYEKD